jgi:ubiquinone/menaquinone biosynthesis C-methylase UbiE
MPEQLSFRRNKAMIADNFQLLQLIQRKKEIIKVYNLASDGYDLPSLKFFSLSATCLVQLLEVKPGQLILDVGTGTGSAAIRAAECCQPGGRVIGVDLAQEMLRVASEKIKAARISNLYLQVGDGENLDFPDNTFDIVLSNASLFFLSDMVAGLKEWQRICKPGGQVAFSGFGLSAFQPLSDLFEKRIRSYGVTFAVPERPFSWQRLTEPEEYWTLLHRAGYQAVEVQVEQLGYYLSNAEEWWQIIWNSGFRGPVSRLTPLELEQFKTEHLAEVGALCDAKGIWLDVPVIFAQGRKPCQSNGTSAWANA